MEIWSSLVKHRSPTKLHIWTLYQCTLGVVEPEKNEIFRISDDGVVGYGWLVELVEKTFQSLVCIPTHRVLKPVCHHFFAVEYVFHRNSYLPFIWQMKKCKQKPTSTRKSVFVVCINVFLVNPLLFLLLRNRHQPS